MGKKKGNDKTKEKWECHLHSLCASKTMLSDILEFVKKEEYSLFRGKTKPKENMIRNISEALASCYIETEERKEAFWSHARTLEGVPNDKAVSYNYEKNLLTWS